MPVCRKCNTVNEEGLTRCRACNAILPVKIGSKSATRWERVRRQPELVGARCPNCGATNPYTRFKCKSCGSSLAANKSASGFRIERILMLLGIAVALLAAILLLALRST